MSVIKNRIQVANEGVKRAADNVVPLVDEQSHVQRTKKIIMSETTWVSSALINSYQKTSKEDESTLANEWKRSGRIFSVDDGGRELFPAYQFDRAWQPLPVIKEILAQLGEAVDGWSIAAWLHFPNGWLSYRDDMGDVVPLAPKDALDRLEDVVEAARKNRTSYVA